MGTGDIPFGSPTMDFRSDHGEIAILLGMLDAKVIRYKLLVYE